MFPLVHHLRQNIPLVSLGVINSLVSRFYETKTPTCVYSRLLLEMGPAVCSESLIRVCSCARCSYLVLVLCIAESMASGGDNPQETPIQETITAVLYLLGLLQSAVGAPAFPLFSSRSDSGHMRALNCTAESNHCYHVWQRANGSPAIRPGHRQSVTFT